jgi:pilus assembly protein CpaF
MSHTLIDQLRTFVLSSSSHDYNTVSRHLRTLSPLLSQREHDSIVRATLADINGLGPLQPHLDNPRVKEVMVVGGRNVFIEDHRGIHHAGEIAPNDVSLIIERVLRRTSRRIDALSPIVDVRLTDGSRVCVVIPPVAVDGPTLSIRKFAKNILEFSHFGDEHLVQTMTALVDDRSNVVVAGATSSGKTSLLAAALSHCNNRERIVVIEDTAELPTQHPHVVRLESRPANAEGVGEITLQHLVRTSLRLRPDRLIVGEVRGSEALDMLMALTSGHRGCWSTCHAQSPIDALHRLSALVMRGSPQWTDAVVHRTIASAIDYVVFVERSHDGKRRVAYIGRVHMSPSGQLSVRSHGDLAPLNDCVTHDA